MAKIAILKLSKHYGNNNPSEVAGFTLDTAAHILKHNGGEKLAEIDPKLERYDVDSGKVVALKASASK